LKIANTRVTINRLLFTIVFNEKLLGLTPESHPVLTVLWPFLWPNHVRSQLGHTWDSWGVLICYS